MAETWAKLSGKISEKDMKILEDNIYISSHKKTSKDLEDEVKKMKEQIIHLNIRNDNLQHQIPLLKMDYERSIQSNPTTNKLLQTSLHLCHEIQKQQLENSQNLNSIYSRHEQEFHEIKSLYERQIPEYKVYKEIATSLKRMQLLDKILSQEMSDVQEACVEKKRIQREIFHKRIVYFVKTVKDYQENLKILYLIDKKTQAGNVLLKAYEEKCKRIEMEKRGIKSLFNNVQNVLPFMGSKLPSISERPLPKASPTMSVCSMKSTKKYSLGAAELSKLKEREAERMKLLKKLTSNEKIFPNKEDDGIKTNKFPKLDCKTSRPNKLQTVSSKDNLKNCSLEAESLGKRVEATPSKKRSIEINYNLETVKKMSTKKLEILENIIVAPKDQEGKKLSQENIKLSQENKTSSQESPNSEEGKQQKAFKQPMSLNSSPFFGKKGNPEPTETPFIQAKTTPKDDEIFKVPYDTSFEMKYSQDYSFIEEGPCNFNMNKDFLSPDAPFDEASPFSPPQAITETENDDTNSGFADFAFGEKRKDKNSFFSFN